MNVGIVAVMAVFGGKPRGIIVHSSKSTYLYDNRRVEETKTR